MKTFMRCGNDSWSIRVVDSEAPAPNFTPCDYCVVIDRAEYLALAFSRYESETSEALYALQSSVLASS